MAASSSNDVKRIPYRYPWLIYVPTAILFGLLNYLVLGTTVNAEGTALVQPAYVAAVEKAYPGSLASRAAVSFERDIMGGLFLVARRVFGGMEGAQIIWVVAWIIHFFELGMCVRICLACHASTWTTLRYCFCTVTAGFAQLVPLQQERAIYLGKTKSATKAGATTTSTKSPNVKASPKKAAAPTSASAKKAKKSQ